MIFSSSDIELLIGDDPIIKAICDIEIVDAKPALKAGSGVVIYIKRYPELSEFEAKWDIWIIDYDNEPVDIVIRQLRKLLPQFTILEEGAIIKASTTELKSEKTESEIKIEPAAPKEDPYEEKFQDLLQSIEDRMLLVGPGRPGRDGKDGKDGSNGRDGLDGKDLEATDVELGELSDVFVSDANRGQFLMFDGAGWIPRFVPQVFSSGGGGSSGEGGGGTMPEPPDDGRFYLRRVTNNTGQWVDLLTALNSLYLDGGDFDGVEFKGEIGDLAINGYESSLQIIKTLFANQGDIVVSASSATLLYIRSISMPAEAGSLALTVQDAQFDVNTTLLASAGSFTASGQAVGGVRGYKLSANAGSFIVTGKELDYPVVINAQINSDSTADTTAVVTTPSHQQGDLLVAVLMWRSNLGTLTVPTGWTLQGTYTNSIVFSGLVQNLLVYTKTAGASEPSSYTWSATTSTRNAWLIASIRNGVLDGVTESYGNGSTATINTKPGVLNLTAFTWVYAKTSGTESYSQSAADSSLTQISDSPKSFARLSGGYTTSKTVVTSTHLSTDTLDSPNHGGISIAIRTKRLLVLITEAGTFAAAGQDAQLPYVSPVFSYVSYTGNDTARSITGVGFQPSMVWISSRLSGLTYDPIIFDARRGTGRYIATNITGREYVDAQTLTSFDSDGFSLGTSSTTNSSLFSRVYDAYCWKGLGSAATNNDGTTATTVQYSDTAGFSIFTYTGNSTADTTVGHGLGAAPEFVFIQQRTSGYNRRAACHSSYLSGGISWSLQLTDGATSSTQYIRSVGSSTLTLSSDSQVNGSSILTYVGFAFKTVPGVSKLGIATGDGTGTLSVDVGFMPRFLLVKTYIGSSNWFLYRPTSGATGYATYTYLDSSIANTVSTELQITSTGFSIDAGGIGNVNGSTSSIWYMAYA